MSFNRMGRILRDHTTDPSMVSLAIHATKKQSRAKKAILRVQLSLGEDFAKKNGYKEGHYIELFWGEDEHAGTIQVAHVEEGPRLRMAGRHLIYASTRVPEDMYAISTIDVEIVSIEEDNFIFKIPPEIEIVRAKPDPIPVVPPQATVQPQMSSQPETPAAAPVEPRPQKEGFTRVEKTRKTWKRPTQD